MVNCSLLQTRFGFSKAKDRPTHAKRKSNTQIDLWRGFRTEGVTFQDYFGHPLPVSACLPELRQKFAEPSERLGGGGVGAAEVSPGFVVVGFSFLGGELALPDLADLLDFLPSWFSVICAFKAAKS